MREWVSINGRLMPADQAQVSVFDSGFMQGIGLFETMRTYNGTVFRQRQHLERLATSARALGWTTIPNVEEIGESVRQVVSATEQRDARVRVTVTTGTLRQVEQETPSLTVVASAAPGGRYPQEYYQKGVAVVISRYRHNSQDPTAGHKTTSYFSRLASLREAYAQSAIEALWFTHDGRLAEGAISSVFLVSKATLLTPPLDTPVLPGITRAAVLELAGEQGIPVREQKLSIDDLLGAEEVFLTNSLMELMPVIRIESEQVYHGKPGETTMRLAAAYNALVASECVED